MSATSTPPKHALHGVQLKFVDSIDDAMALKTWLGERRDVLAFDTETEGLRWTEHRVRLIQLGDALTGWAIPWDLWGGVALECLDAYEGRLVGHNVKFDTHMIERWCDRIIPRHRTDDTMLMSQVLEPHRSAALKSLTSYHIDPRASAAQRQLDELMTGNGWTWATVPIDLQAYWAYGALDTVLTAQLWGILSPRVQAEVPAAYDLELARTWVVQRQERNGCHIDVPYTRDRLDEFEAYVAAAGAWCKEHYGVAPGSNAAIIERLEADGVTVLDKRTGSGARSLDREVLEDAIATSRHPLAETVLQRRRLQKLASAYLSNFIAAADEDGIIHPNVRVMGARTGRESITEPALQTLPRRSSDNPAAITVRNCITGRTEDHTLVMCDFSQIEMRLLAHLSNDDGLRAAFGQGDFFTNVARELNGDPNLDKSDPRRQLTKNGMYALSYGAGAEKIALTAGVPLAAVHDFLGQLDARFPGIRRLQHDVDRVARERAEEEGEAYVRSPLTRRRHVADERREYALVNFLIQGTAAEVFKMKTVELAAAGLDEYLVLGVHDEVVLDVPNDEVEAVTETVHRIMNDDQLLSVPIEADVVHAYRWGEAVK